MNDEPISTKSKSHSLDEFFFFSDTGNKSVLLTIVAESLSPSLTLSLSLSLSVSLSSLHIFKVIQSERNLYRTNKVKIYSKNDKDKAWAFLSRQLLLPVR